MSTPDDMLREAERAVEANPCPETWQALAVVRERVGWKSPAHINRETLARLMEENDHVTKEIAILAGEVGESFWTGDYLHGTVQEWRVNGKCKTWVREPTHFNLPVKQGWNTCSYVTHHNCENFKTKRPMGPLSVTVRRVPLKGDYTAKNDLVPEGIYQGKGQKLWAFEVEGTPGIALPPGPGYVLHSVTNVSTQTRLVRASDRDAVRILIKGTYRMHGLAVTFRR